MRLVVAGGSCGTNHTGYHWAMHPTQWRLRGDEEAGMVVGNFAITMGFWLVCYIGLRGVVTLGGKLKPEVFEEVDAQGLLRFPSAPLLVFQFLFQGTSLGAMKLVVQRPSHIGFAIGLGGMLTCFAIPFVMLRCIARDVPALAVYVRDPTTPNKYCLTRFLCGPGEWVNSQGHVNWMARWSIAVRAYKQPLGWWMFLDFAVSFVVAALHATPIEPGNMIQCGHQKAFTAFVFFFITSLESLHQPQCRFRDVCVSISANALQGFAMAFMATGYYQRDLNYVGFELAGNVMMLALGMLMSKTVLDLIALAYILIGGRRRRLQKALAHQMERHLPAPEPAASMCEEGLVELDAFEAGRTASQRSFGTPNRQDLHGSYQSLPVHSLRRDSPGNTYVYPERYMPRTPRDRDAVRRTSAGLLLSFDLGDGPVPPLRTRQPSAGSGRGEKASPRVRHDTGTGTFSDELDASHTHPHLDDSVSMAGSASLLTVPPSAAGAGLASRRVKQRSPRDRPPPSPLSYRSFLAPPEARQHSVHHLLQ
eukprot:TRINITY_DN7138_c0_g1_i1.p1 TRINITY_DN7138_c0_g1~~TRINITY_DN7138_c0_g1_i1.p1  ORF type:complete len:534 (+),score=138.42 TRINITY_DN7138_c0_g1_i1:607-2208(+)